MILRRESSPPNSLEVLIFLVLLINLTILSYAVFAPPPFSTDSITDLKTSLDSLEQEVRVLKTKGEEKTNSKN